MNKEDLVDSWEQTVGFKIQSVEDFSFEYDDPVELTVVKFTNGKFLIQRDQGYYTTICGLVSKHDFEETKRMIELKKQKDGK